MDLFALSDQQIPYSLVHADLVVDLPITPQSGPDSATRTSQDGQKRSTTSICFQYIFER